MQASIWSVIRVKIKIQIMLLFSAVYSAAFLNYVRLFSIMFGSLDLKPKFYLAYNYIGRFLDV